MCIYLFINLLDCKISKIILSKYVRWCTIFSLGFLTTGLFLSYAYSGCPVFRYAMLIHLVDDPPSSCKSNEYKALFQHHSLTVIKETCLESKNSRYVHLKVNTVDTHVQNYSKIKIRVFCRPRYRPQSVCTHWNLT